MQEANRLTAELDRARSTTHELLKKIAQKQEVYPGWSIKEFLAHLTGWDECTLAALEAHASDLTPGTPAKIGLNNYNERSVAARQALPYETVLAEFEQVREDLKACLHTLPSQKFDQPLIFPWGPTGSVKELVEIMIEHEIEHAEELDQKLVDGK